MRLAPVDPAQALVMLDELRMAPAFAGARGEARVDREALAGAVSGFSRLVAAVPALAEIEVNPLVAGAAGVVAVDARATLSPPETT